MQHAMQVKPAESESRSGGLRSPICISFHFGFVCFTLPQQGESERFLLSWYTAVSHVENICLTALSLAVLCTFTEFHVVKYIGKTPHFNPAFVESSFVKEAWKL